MSGADAAVSGFLYRRLRFNRPLPPSPKTVGKGSHSSSRLQNRQQLLSESSIPIFSVRNGDNSEFFCNCNFGDIEVVDRGWHCIDYFNLPRPTWGAWCCSGRPSTCGCDGFSCSQANFVNEACQCFQYTRADPLEASIAAVSKYGGANTGYCTLLDALIPAYSGLREKLDAGNDLYMAFLLSSEAALSGTESTKQLQAGCSSYIFGEILATVRDPEAMAV